MVDGKIANLFCFAADLSFSRDDLTFKKMRRSCKLIPGFIDRYFSGDKDLEARFLTEFSADSVLRGFAKLDSSARKYPNRNVPSFYE